MYAHCEEPNTTLSDTPEKELISAVVHRALSDLQQKDLVTRALARNWIFDDSIGPWSFRWCCLHMNLDAIELTIRLKSVQLFNHIEKLHEQPVHRRGRKAKYFGKGPTVQSIFVIR